MFRLWPMIIAFLFLPLLCPPGQAATWSMHVGIDPLNAQTDQLTNFTLALRNEGPYEVNVSQVRILFQGDEPAAGLGYLVTNVPFLLRPGAHREFLVQRYFSGGGGRDVNISVFVEAKSILDVYPEEQEYPLRIFAGQAAAEPSGQYWVWGVVGGWLIIAAVAITVVWVVVAPKAKKTRIGKPAKTTLAAPKPHPGPPSVMPTSGPRPCPSCGRPLRYYPISKRRFCEAESKYF